MNQQAETTLFAPAERAEDEILQQQRDFFSKQDQAKPYLDAIPEVFLILNEQRQVVFANQTFLEFLGIKDDSTICGFRPGEILSCAHASENAGGCGTTEFCRECGAVNAILSSLGGKQSVRECRILQKDTGDALDLRVWATPYRVEGKLYSIFVVNDISHEKRKKSLERIFYHDVLNTAGGLLGFARLLRDADASKIETIRERIYHLANKLIEEIKAQRELSAAENNELSVNPISLKSLTLLGEIAVEYKNHDSLGDRIVLVDPNSNNVDFKSDCTLIQRVIGNMLKNALEASKPGETVALGCETNGERISFWVHNPAFIPRDVQLQIFQRSFSTKGSDRGLGTYSIKLLSERYLQGHASFSSSEENGTKFVVTYPLQLQAR